jgi:hypothetical protein
MLEFLNKIMVEYYLLFTLQLNPSGKGEAYYALRFHGFFVFKSFISSLQVVCEITKVEL